MSQPSRSARASALPEKILTERIPPYAGPAERAVLGGLLNGCALPADLSPTWFYEERHRVLCRVIAAMIDDGQPVDLMTVGEMVKVLHPRDPIPSAYLAQLFEEGLGVTVETLPKYITMVRESAARREAIRISSGLIDRAYQPDAQLTDLQQDADRLVEAVAISQADGDMRPSVARVGDSYTLTWRVTRTRILFEGLSQTSEGTWAEASIQNGAKLLLPPTRVNLLSDHGRSALVKRLKRSSGLGWDDMVEEAVGAVLAAARASNPAEPLSGDVPSGRALDLIANVLPAGEVTLTYGDGDNLKSMVDMVIARAAASGKAVAGGLIRPTIARGVSVLWLDYETSKAPTLRRKNRLAEGLGLTDAGRLFYKRLSEPLWTVIREVRREVAELGIGLVVLDSLAAASGEAPESPGAALQAIGALRSLEGVTSLVIAHVSKAVADAHGPSRPFGSVAIRNGARQAWEVKGGEADTLSDGSQVRVVSLSCQKSNDGPRPKPVTLRFIFGPEKGVGPIRVEPGSLVDAPAAMGKATLPQRIEAVLERAETLTLDGLLDALTPVSQKTLTTTLARMVGKRLVRLESSDGPVRWALRSRRTL